MEKLKAEQSEFAQEIIRELEVQPKLSLELTLKYLDCLVAEYNFAANLANSGQMEKQEKVNNIDSFFNHVSTSIDYLPNAIEPVREFYTEYPENIRLFLNEQNLRKGLIDRANQEIDVAAFMKNNQHMLDGSTRVLDLRKMRVELEELKRDFKIKIDNLKKIYRRKIVYLNNIKDFGTVLEDSMNAFFEKANQARFNGYANVAKVASVKPKRDFFSLVRNSILNNKLTEDFDEIENIKKQQQWNRSMQRLLIFPKDDRKSFYENQLPDQILQIVDKESNDQIFRTRTIRSKFYETRYGDLYQEFSQQIDKFNRMQFTMLHNRISLIIQQNTQKEKKLKIFQISQNKIRMKLLLIYKMTQFNRLIKKSFQINQNRKQNNLNRRKKFHQLQKG